MWMDALALRGVELTAADAHTIELREGGHSARFHVQRLTRSPRPSELKPPRSRNWLLLAPHVSDIAAKRLLELGWSWVTDRGELHLRLGDHVVRASSSDADQSGAPLAPTAAPLRRVRGMGGYAILRRIIEAPPGAALRQAQLAQSVGVTQARISQLVAALRADGVLQPQTRAPVLVDRQVAIDRWLAGYPGPGGTVTHWASLDDMWTATAHVLDALPRDSIVSADAAADLLTAWRQPRHSIVYAHAVTDLSRTGLVQVAENAQAVVTVCVPIDRSVWPLAPIKRSIASRTVLLAGPLQVLWDTQREPGTDTAQVVVQLRQALEDPASDSRGRHATRAG